MKKLIIGLLVLGILVIGVLGFTNSDLLAKPETPAVEDADAPDIPEVFICWCLMVSLR